ncbi:hypothetical protein NHX12_004140 [Muraenolepis orangiensis]|uniref:Uncharacterized protein n=1 Tax=Muraenolepis orangiensis TaxID=630683 RepID=A0A9Q0IDW5_9TELE|nr:hypothetical protein NHX12_004140 [Muraenolepis orangiensis]
MFRKPWISSFHATLEHEVPLSGLNSFQSNNLVVHRTALVKSVSETDLLAVLPKVSELKKLFERARQSDSGMNRKERVARRLEGIEGDAPPALVPGGLVANRMLEEDAPRYTRASDPCEPRVTVRRYAREEMDAPVVHLGSPDRSSRVRSGGGASSSHRGASGSPRTASGSHRGATAGPTAEPVAVSPRTTSSDPGGLSSKAERIARYKAERRRQLSERYGVLLDQEADLDYTPRYRSRREAPDATDQHPLPVRRDRDRSVAAGEEGPEPKVPYSSGVGRVYMHAHSDKDLPSSSGSSSVHAHPAQAPPPTHERPRRFSERESAMNIENYRRGGGGGAQEAPRTARPRSEEQYQPQTSKPHPLHHQPHPHPQHQHQHQPAAPQEPSQPAPSRDLSMGAVPSSPRSGRRASLPSVRYGISPGDLFIEQQAQSILNRQGIRARERPRDEAVNRPSEWSPDRLQGNRPHGQAGGAPQQLSDQNYQRTAPHPSPGHQPEPGHAAYHTYPAGTDTTTTTRLPGPPEVQPRRRVSTDQIYAAHREARREARQTMKEEPHTEGLLKSRKAVLPSEIRRQGKSTDGGQSDDGESETATPRARRAPRPEEDWMKEQPRERGRERDRTRGLTARSTGADDPLMGLDGQEERAFRNAHHKKHPGTSERATGSQSLSLDNKSPNDSSWSSKGALKRSNCNGLKRSNCNGLKRSNCNGLKRSNCNTLKRSNCNALKRSNCNALKRSNCNAIKRSNYNALKRSNCNALKRSNCNALKRSNCNALKRSNCNALKKSNCNALKRSNCNALKRSNCNALKRSNCNALKRSNCNALKRSNCNALKRSNCNALKRSNCNALKRSNCNALRSLRSRGSRP